MLCVLIRIASLSIQLLCRKSKKNYPKLSLFASWPGAMINPQWLELPMSRTNFYGPKDIRAVEVRLYVQDIPCWSYATDTVHLLCEPPHQKTFATSENIAVHVGKEWR